MKLRSFLFILLSSTTLISCGGSVSTSESSQKAVDNIEFFDSKKELKDAIENSTVICGVADLECPNNVVKLIFWSKNKKKGRYMKGVCSGTLIEDGYLVTNSHCVPNDLKNGDDCSDRILIQLPETKTSRKENLKCISVVQVFKYKNDTNPDIALLKIQRSKLNTVDRVKTVKNDFSQEKSVYAYPMSPMGYAGIISRRDCTVSMRGLYRGKLEIDDKDFMITGRECRLVGGNSGSGLFNKSGKLIGAIHQKLNRGGLKKLFKYHSIKHEKLAPMGIAVNIACLQSLTSAKGNGCSPNKPKMTIDEYLDLVKKEASLEDVSESKIEAIITSKLEVRLKAWEGIISTPPQSLSELRRKLAKVEAINTSQLINKNIK